MPALWWFHLRRRKGWDAFGVRTFPNSLCPNVDHGLRPHHIANKSAKSSVCFEIQGPKRCVLRHFMLEEKNETCIYMYCGLDVGHVQKETVSTIILSSNRLAYIYMLQPSSVRSSMGGTMSKFKRLLYVNFRYVLLQDVPNIRYFMPNNPLVHIQQILLQQR